MQEMRLRISFFQSLTQSFLSLRRESRETGYNTIKMLFEIRKMCYIVREKRDESGDEHVLWKSEGI